jgi:peptidyl-prolyl cis-trans isomerase SurA
VGENPRIIKKGIAENMEVSRKITWITVWICLIGITAFPVLSAETDEGTVVDRIVAIVNDDIVTLSEVNEVFEPYAEKIRAYGYLPDKEKEMLFGAREEIVNQLVEKKLADQEINKAGIVVEDNEVDSAIERIKKRSYWTDEELRENLARDGLTLEQYRLRMKKQIQRARLLDYKVKSKIIITNEDISAYYQNHPEKYSGIVKYHLRNIILQLPAYSGDEDKEAVLGRMKIIHERLRQGESFEMLAKLYSESSLAQDGGDLGLFQLQELSGPIQTAMKDLQAGQFTDILQTDSGYQIFFVEKIVTIPGKTLEEASPEIEEVLYGEMLDSALKAWIDDMKKDAHIKIIF